MSSLRHFVIFLFVAFLGPWYFLIAKPHGELRALQPVMVDEEDPGKGTYPPVRPNTFKDGELVFARQGCANCHTQVIRPTYLGLDSFKRGWGAEQEEMVHTRETRPEDYIGDRYAFIGIQRNGPDLANAGHRLTDVKQVHAHLYNPRQFTVWSNMPSYRHLYEQRKIQGQPSVDALELEGELAPPPGYEVVPTNDARVLVDYLMTLRRDGEVPGAAAAAEAAAGQGGEAAK